MVQALIKPQIVKWARENANLNEDIIAAALKIKIDKYLAWENGEELPSFIQAQKLAKKLQIPFGFLYLNKPPEKSIPIPDLRTINNIKNDFSINFQDIIKSALRKQEWLSNYLKGEDEDKVDFIGKFGINDDYHTIAKDIREKLDIDIKAAKKIKTWADYLSYLAHKAELKNIIVLRNSVVGNNTNRHLNVSEFRGFAICDQYAPLIFINTDDSKAAQIFTFAHELAHLWLGESGISDIFIDTDNETQNKNIEYFCNSIAGEFLIPSDLIIKNKNINSQILSDLANEFKVSTVVILRRAYDLKIINKNTYYSLLEVEKEKQKLPLKTSSGGDFYKTNLLRNGEILTNYLINSVLEGKVLYREAALILDVKVETIRKIADQMSIRS